MKEAIYTIDNVSKTFIEWCREYDQSPLVIQSRISMGSSFEAALHMVDTKRDLLYCIDGEVHTFQHWCRIYKINESTVKNRLSKGQHPSTAFKTPVKKRKAGKDSLIFNINGTHKAIAELSAEYGINQSTIKARLVRGENIYQALDIDENYKRIGNKTKENEYSDYRMYTIDRTTKTLKSWCNEFGISTATIKNRMRLGWTLEELFSPLGDKYLHDIKIDDKNERMTMAQISKRFNINKVTLRGRLLKGMTIEEAVEAKVRKQESHRKSNEIFKIDGTRLKEIRKTIVPGMTINDFVKKLNTYNYSFTRGIVYLIENNKRYVSIDELEILENVLGVPLRDLIIEEVKRKS